MSSNRLARGLQRRTFLKQAAAGVVGLPALQIAGAMPSAAAETLVFVAYGGSTQDAQMELIVGPYQKETGNRVIGASGPDLAKLKAQVQTRNNEWDLVSFIGTQAAAAEKAGLLEKFDSSVADYSDSYYKGSEFSIPWYSYGLGIAFDPKRHPTGRHPTDWQQFWDVKNFPGRRGLRSRPDETMEMALLADGVSPKSLYPLDVDRAFASLNKLKPHVTRWIAETPQTVTLVQQNEVDFVPTYNGRVDAAQKQGISMDFVYENNIVTAAYLCMPKGVRHKAAANQLASYFLRPDLQAAFCNRMIYSPSRRSAMPLLTPDVQSKQPKLDSPGTVVTDVAWWSENFARVNERFKEWMLS
jgi:putative spermidine/putrescine transport system substrate-binding protein